MLLGPITIRKCSACGKNISHFSLISGNTVGALSWTDGKWLAPMCLENPRLVRCPHCPALVWMPEMKIAGEYEFGAKSDEIPEHLRDAPAGSKPTFAEYMAFLSAGVQDKEKELYVRLRTWWIGNDARRDNPDAPPMTDAEKANLRSLMALMDEEYDNDRLMKAEAFRELGMFDEAEALLATRFDESIMDTVNFIRRLNQNRRVVAEMVLYETPMLVTRRNRTPKKRRGGAPSSN